MYYFALSATTNKTKKLGETKMKTTGKLTRLFAMVILAAMLVLIFASCGKSDRVVLSYEAPNGKTYTLSEAEYAFLMKYRKYEIFSSYGYPSAWDTDQFWNSDAGDNRTLDATVTESVLETAKSIVIERYLMDEYGLALENNEETKKSMDKAAENVKKAVSNLGGTGAFRRYWGYMPEELINYNNLILQSSMVSDHLYGHSHDNHHVEGVTPITDEDLNKYYTENYKQYLMILINTKEDIAKDDDGNIQYVCYDKNGKEVIVTDISEEYLKEKEYTLGYSYEYKEIKDEDRIEEKKGYSDVILQQLKDGADFKELALKYSDEFLTSYYENGYMVSGDLISDKDAIKAIEKLEIGDYTEEAISLQSGKYVYIIKRVELTEKAYTHADEDAEETEYADIFKNFKTTVKSHTYSELIKDYAESIVVNTEIVGKYSMKDTFLSKEILYTYG